MERLKRYKSFMLVSIAIAAAVLLGACDNPVDLLETVSVEVMKGNDRFLEVVAYAPVEYLGQDVDPGSTILLNLDRAIDPAAITEDMVQFVYTTNSNPTPQVTVWNASFNESTKILSLRPEPYLEDEADYTITIDGLVASDGSRMLDSISWAFKTGISPKGSVRIRDVLDVSDIGYSNSNNVRVTVSTSSSADSWCASTEPFSVINSTLPWVNSLATPIDLTLVSPSQGPITVYVAFRNNGTATYGVQTYGTVIYDTLKPVIQPVTAIYTKTTSTISPLITELNPKTYAWSGAGITFGSPSVASSTAYSTSDGSRVARLTVADKAGNVESRDIPFTWDATSPSVNLGADRFVKSATALSATITELNVLSYSWSVTSGTGVTLSTPTASSTSATASGDGARTIRLTVTDKCGNSGYDDMVFTWDATSPIINVGTDLFTNVSKTLSAAITESNVQTYQWSVISGSGITLGSPTSSTTSASASSDGQRTIRLTVTDKAGNTGFDDLLFTWDSTPPLQPSVSGTSPTFDSTPTWTWVSGGGGGGTTYRYILSVGWTIGTNIFSYTPSSSLGDGVYTLSVQQRDSLYDYYSSSGTWSIRVTSVLPYHLETNVSRTPTLTWRDMGILASYTVEFYNSVTRAWTAVASTGGTESYKVTVSLPVNTTVNWRVKSVSGKITSYLPSSSGALFKTVLF
jgi:hypothetical protein